ncbi:MAG: glycosyltransferase family 4 protein [Eubacterium sp.]|nr:glycosyltransferase family 4 protein [Eubacterium sp.]
MGNACLLYNVCRLPEKTVGAGLKRLHILKIGTRNVILLGHISFSERFSFYKTAHVFLRMSEHEGFCVPLVEAMYFDVPILAYAAAGKIGIF